MNNYGLNYHAVPVLAFQKILASEIMHNKNYEDVAELEMKLTLKKAKYYDSQKPNST